MYAHFAAIIGIPAAAGAAFVLVSLLRQLDGPIEFNVPGFTLKGSTGQIVLWAICFMAFVTALNMLWDKGHKFNDSRATAPAATTISRK